MCPVMTAQKPQLHDMISAKLACLGGRILIEKCDGTFKAPGLSTVVGRFSYW